MTIRAPSGKEEKMEERGMRTGEVKYTGQSWEMERVMLGKEVECYRREASGGEEGAGSEEMHGEEK